MPDYDDDNIPQTGAPQQITEEGMNAFIAQVQGFRVCNRGKKRLFSADRTTLISMSRRRVSS